MRIWSLRHCHVKNTLLTVIRLGYEDNAYESAAALTLHSVTDPAEFNTLYHLKPELPNQTDSNTDLLLLVLNLSARFGT